MTEYRELTHDQQILLSWSSDTHGAAHLASFEKLVSEGQGAVGARLTNADKMKVAQYLLEGVEAQKRTSRAAVQPASVRGMKVRVETVVGSGHASLDAQVRSMSGKDAHAACKRHGIHVDEDAPNGGVLAMRAKNALLNRVRRGELVAL